MFKSLLISTVTVALLTAAPQTAASAANAYERTSTKTYEVSAKGNKYDGRDKVFDDALYKAAKKTLKNDYDWFRVIDREYETEKTTSSNRFRESVRRVPERRCGLLGCSTTYRTDYHSDIRSGFYDRDEIKHSVRIEYIMGIGPVEDIKNVYDARDIKALK